MAGARGGRVMAHGAGWAWLRDGDAVIHVCGPLGPRGPLTAVVPAVPVVAPGDRLRLDTTRAAIWQLEPAPEPAADDDIAAACIALAPHRWNDPRALRLGLEHIDIVAADLAGRGPGLTPAGDDALCGFAFARRASARPDVEVVADALRRSAAATGEPSASLMRAAADGQVYAPAVQVCHALLRADGPALAPAVRQLTRLGSSTGRALLTGLLQGLGPITGA